MAVAVGVLVATTGCSELDEPAAAGLTRTDLVADLAVQLDDASDLTYEATYQLLGGDTGTIAQQQDPARSAFVYPGGKLIVTADSTTQCATGKAPATCIVTAHSPAPSSGGSADSPPPGSADSPPGGSTDPRPGESTDPRPGGSADSPLGGSAGQGGSAPRSGPGVASPAPGTTAQAEAAGLVSPATVQTMLNRAIPDPDVDVRQHDTTIAGRHATCVELIGLDTAGTRDFEACVTTEGVLGSFTGTIADKPIEIAMTHYADRVSAETITPPSDAHITTTG